MNTALIDRNAANRYQAGREYFRQLFAAGIIPKCSGGYIEGGCNHGHKLAAPYLCGKEYCKDCGKDGSPIHARRLKRWQDLVKDWPKLGYIVLTFPEQIRWFFFDKEVLADFRYQLRRKLQRDGIKEGLARWHWFGDCQTCNGAGCVHCDHTGSGKTWHPHLNVLIKGGYMPSGDLLKFRENLQRWCRRYYLRLVANHINKKELVLKNHTHSLANQAQTFEEIELLQRIINEEKKRLPVIHYSYTKDPDKITNRLKYVLRSTFRIYDLETKKELHNFRNCIRWGFGKIKAEKGLIYCPACKVLHRETPINWTNRANYTNNIKYTNYDEGIYTIYKGSCGAGRALQYPTKKIPGRIARLLPRRHHHH